MQHIASASSASTLAFGSNLYANVEIKLTFYKAMPHPALPSAAIITCCFIKLNKRTLNGFQSPQRLQNAYNHYQEHVGTLILYGHLQFSVSSLVLPNARLKSRALLPAYGPLLRSAAGGDTLALPQHNIPTWQHLFVPSSRTDFG